MIRRGRDAALSEEQIREYVERCPAENRWAFEGWLRGERHLDGDPIEPDLNPTEARAACLWRVRLWLGDLLVEEYLAPASSAERYADLTRRRIEGLPGRRLTCEPALADLPEERDEVRIGMWSTCSAGCSRVCTATRSTGPQSGLGGSGA